LAEERRAKIAQDYKDATAAKDAAKAELDQLKMDVAGSVEEFDESLITDPDFYAHYESLVEAYNNADTAYNLAAVQIQDQLAEAAAAAKAVADKALADARAVLETNRQTEITTIDSNIAAKLTEIDDANFNKTLIAESIEFATDDDERNELLASLAATKIEIRALNSDLEVLEAGKTTTMDRHTKERDAEKAADKAAAEKAAADKAFNEYASTVVNEYNGYLNEKARFENLRNTKQKELDDLEA
jgi:colicin import membrane protein